MTEMKQFPEQSSEELVFYRRVSGFAIAGFAAGAIFAVYLLVQAAVSLRSSAPLLVHPAMQAIPAVGIILSLIGLLLIGRSEGTLAGRGLAIWGAGLSLVFGLGYLAYYGTTYYVTGQQADAFVTRCFKEKLAQGKLYHAFLDTQHPAIRKRTNPDNTAEMETRFNSPVRPAGTSPSGSKGFIDIFRDTDFVKAIMQAKGEVSVEPLGVSDWDFKTDAYKVQRLYRITTPAVAYEVLITALGLESSKHEFEGREWQIVFPESKVRKTTLTETGARVQQLEQESTKFAREWMLKVLGGQLFGAFLETQPAGERESLQTAGAAGLLGGILASSMPTQMGGPAAGILRVSAGTDFELARTLYLRKYADLFHRMEIVNSQGLSAGDPKGREIVLDALRELFSAPGGPPRVGALDVGADTSRKSWEIDAEHRLNLPHSLKFLVGPRDFRFGQGQAYACEAIITILSGPGALESSSEPKWTVAGIDLVKVEEALIPGATRGPTPSGPPSRGAPPAGMARPKAPR
jgi:hypothetical protein